MSNNCGASLASTERSGYVPEGAPALPALPRGGSAVAPPGVIYRTPGPPRPAPAAGAPPPVSPVQTLVYLLGDAAVIDEARAAASARAYPLVPGSENAAFVWWLLGKSGFPLPFAPQQNQLLTMLLMRGAAVLPPGETPKCGDLAVSENGFLSFVRKIGISGPAPWVAAVNEATDRDSVLVAEVAYFLRLPGG